ncbi:MAG: hypothetical protein COT18_04150, partial [Elusimicrobia bacterium CG08_land_8_20_14_0_20_59_10]
MKTRAAAAGGFLNHSAHLLESDSMLPDLRQILLRSGPCLDRLWLLRFYLAAVESPLLKWPLILLRLKFSPDILEKIRASGLPPEEKGRLFSRAMTLFRSGCAYKTTAAGRSPLTDSAVLEKVKPGNLLVETGVSDGISAAGLLASVKDAELVLSDRQTGFRCLDRGPARFFYNNENGALSLKLPGFYLCAGIAAGPVPENAGTIKALNPLLEAGFPKAEIIPFDIFTGSLPRRADIIKCANVLSNVGFTPAQMRDAVANLAKNLAPGGWLFISQNNTRYKDGEALVALQEAGGRLALRREVNGHEILEHFKAPLFAELLIADELLAAAEPAPPGDDGQDLLHYLFRRLAGEQPGEGGVAFLRHLSWIGVSFAVAKVISALVNIAAGNLLGPAEYGRINVLVSAGAAISPFIIAGLNNSVIRYGVAPQDRSAIFTAAGAIFLALAAVAAGVVLYFRQAMSALLGIPPGLLGLALCYALATAAFMLASGFLQASGEFSKRGLTEIAFSVVLSAAFFLGIYGLGRTYQAMAYAYVAAFGGLGLFWLAKFAFSIRFSFPVKEKFRELTKYSAYSFGGGLGYYLTLNVQGLILNAFLAPEKVGLYAACNTATIGIAAYLGYAIGTVLFPKASASTNRRRLWEMTVKGWARLVPALMIFFIGMQAAVLSLMGRHQYQLRPSLM